jgi:site-specific DNA recombinase
METKTKVYGYVRVSTDDQENSKDLQIKRIKEYCLFKSLDLVTIFVDENVSGFKEFNTRPEGSKLNLLLTKNVKALVAIKPDRLFRNTANALETVDKWDNMGIELHMIDMGGATLATKTAMGKMLFTVLIAFSQFERSITGERVTAILNNKKSEGKVYTSRLLGFDKKDGVMVKNEAEQEIIREIKQLSTNYKPARIARIINRVGYRTKSNKTFFPSTVRYILNNEIYS